MRFIGDGAQQHVHLITQTFGERAYIDQDAPPFVSLKSIAHEALQLWNKHETCQQLLPLYLKN